MNRNVKMEDWKFHDAPNVAVVINKKIIRGEAWIGYVSHDLEDSGWQFHCGGGIEFSMSDAGLVSLRSVVQLDPSIELLVDLPLGWHAWRESPQGDWRREETRSE